MQLGQLRYLGGILFLTIFADVYKAADLFFFSFLILIGCIPKSGSKASYVLQNVPLNSRGPQKIMEGQI